MSLVNPNVEKMAGYIPGEQPESLDVIKLNTNENPYPPSPKVREAIAKITDEELRRYPSPDARVFRAMAGSVHSVDPEFIITTNGGDELLSIVFRACLLPGDRVARLDPSYSLYPVLAAAIGATPVMLPYRIDGLQWHLPEEIFHLDARLLLIVNPNAPSGTRIDPHTLERIAHSFGGVVLIDEAYADFAPQTALSLVHKCPNVILLRSMSKGYGLAGIRFGYGIGRPELLAQLYKVRDSYPCDAVAIAAATAAIEDQPYARSTWINVIEQRRWLQKTLMDMDFAGPESFSNFILATVPRGHSAADIYAKLKAGGILVRYFNLPGLQDKLRITVGKPADNQALIKALRRIVAGRSISLQETA